MYELGRARAIHACQRIVTLAAKGDWEIKNLPFDINHTVIPPVDIDNTDVFYHLIKKSVKFAYDSPETIFLHDDRVLYSDYQIQKNINSGKYLPNTFLEKRNLKEHLRFFADPYLFSSYIADKIYRFNFHRLNRGKKYGTSLGLTLMLSNFKLTVLHLVFPNFMNLFCGLKTIWQTKQMNFIMVQTRAI